MNNLAKVRAELERRIKLADCPQNESEVYICEQLLTFIDSLTGEKMTEEQEYAEDLKWSYATGEKEKPVYQLPIMDSSIPRQYYRRNDDGEVKEITMKEAYDGYLKYFGEKEEPKIPSQSEINEHFGNITQFTTPSIPEQWTLPDFTYTP
jgi:hypothetical protein